jgi:curved DNA-binding protein CbpA
MISGKNYYQILGVLPDAEDIVIKAAYRALSQKYHPDRWINDSRYAHEMMANINRAYEILSDQIQRKNYNDELEKFTAENNKFYFYEEDILQEGYSESENDWKLAQEFYPDIQIQFIKLQSLNFALAFAFRETLLKGKNFKESANTFENLKNTYLQKYFGKSKPILKFAEFLIVNKHKDAAEELYKIISVIGDDSNSEQIIEKIQNKYLKNKRSKSLEMSLLHLGLLTKKKKYGYECIFLSNGECGVFEKNIARIYDTEHNLVMSINNHKTKNHFLETGLVELIYIDT